MSQSSTPYLLGAAAPHTKTPKLLGLEDNTAELDPFLTARWKLNKTQRANKTTYSAPAVMPQVSLPYRNYERS